MSVDTKVNNVFFWDSPCLWRRALNSSREYATIICLKHIRIWFKFLLANMEAATATNMKSLSFSPNNLFPSHPPKTSNMTGSSAAMFLVDTYPNPSPLVNETSNQMIQFNPFHFLSAKKCSSILSRTNNYYRKFSLKGKRSSSQQITLTRYFQQWKISIPFHCIQKHSNS